VVRKQVISKRMVISLGVVICKDDNWRCGYMAFGILAIKGFYYVILGGQYAIMPFTNQPFPHKYNLFYQPIATFSFVFGELTTDDREFLIFEGLLGLVHHLK